MISKPRILHQSIVMALMMSFIWVVFAQTAFSKTQPAQSLESSEILQFTSSGHVLGFHPNGVYVVTGRYMLRETFAGTKGVPPKSNRPSAQDGQSQSLDKVSYPHLWDNITLTYDKPSNGILRSTFRVEPGADPGQIALTYSVPVRLDASGRLVFQFETGTMTASAPVAWQDVDGKRHPVKVTFHLKDSNPTVHFSLGAFNPALPLFIDPTLSWNTFLGSSKADSARAIAVDASGNVYVAGESESRWGSPKRAHRGNYDAFAAKLNSTGVLQWNTFMGSSPGDAAYAITTDGEGNVYVAGRSEATWGNPVNRHAGGYDAFTAKLNTNGELQWNTFMGSSDSDCIYSITVDESGNIYVAGESGDTWGNPVKSHVGGIDAFAAKLNNRGELEWNTFMGSSDTDGMRAIAVDQGGNVYLAGFSFAAWGKPIKAYAGGFEAFAVKLNCSGSLLWSTFMGSRTHDYAYGIAVDGEGGVYVAGESGTSWGMPLKAHAGNFDAFAVKLDSRGNLLWNTFMGSFSNDYGRSIAVDGEGNVYLAGRSKAAWGKPMGLHSGGYDAFAAKLNKSGALQWNTFMGLSLVDYGYGIAVDGSGGVYVVGESESSWGGPLRAYSGDYDGFVAKVLK